MEEREEKRKSATQVCGGFLTEEHGELSDGGMLAHPVFLLKVFEKWKSERDHLLREKYRKQKEAERKLQQKKREEGERRRSDSRSAFSDW